MTNKYTIILSGILFCLLVFIGILINEYRNLQYSYKENLIQSSIKAETRISIATCMDMAYRLYGDKEGEK